MFAIALLLTLLVSLASPIRPYLNKIAIDDYLIKSNYNGLLIIVGVIVGIIFLNGILQFLLTYVMQRAGQNILYDIRIKLFSHIQNQSLKYFDKNPVGRSVTRVTNDVEGLNEMFSSGVVMIAADILLIIWLVIFMFLTNWQLAIYILSILPLLLLVSIIFRKKVRVVFQKIRINVARMNSFINEFISGSSTIKLFTQENKQSETFKEINTENKVFWIKTVMYYSTFFPVIELISTIALALVLWQTASSYLTNTISIGTLMAFLGYAELFFRPVRDLTEKWTTMQSAMASSDRIFELLDTNETIESANNENAEFAFKNRIEFRNLSFSYDDNKYAIKDVSFDVSKGETVAIVGATGSGKSTLINLLFRFYDYKQGEILVDGRSLKDFNIQSLRNKIGLVMQDVFLFSRTIEENITLGNENSTTKLNYTMNEIGADEFIDKQLNGLKTEVMERGATLSVGQRQLISLSRAHIKEPDILVLDEATSNIDSETEERIELTLNKLITGKTSIIIAHRLSTIRRADKIIVLHHGKVREIGNHKELLEKNGLYSKLYYLQFAS
jgi:ATP-binding cassette subfamily B protein